MRTRTRRSPLGAQLYFDVGLLGRVLDRVVDQVAEDNVQVHVLCLHGAKLQVELDRVDRHAIAEADGPAQFCSSGPRKMSSTSVSVRLASRRPASSNWVMRRSSRSRSSSMNSIEARLLLLRHLAAVERLQVELHGGDGGFQFVGDAVDEVGLPPVEIDRLDREDQVDDHAGQQHPDERGAQRQQDPKQGRPRPAPHAPNTLSNTQPTVSTTSSAIMTMASRMGKRKERRVNMVVEGWTAVEEDGPPGGSYRAAWVPLEHNKPAGRPSSCRPCVAAANAHFSTGCPCPQQARLLQADQIAKVVG